MAVALERHSTMKAGCFQEDDFKSNRTWRCFHSGDLGDIIYSLLFCKSLGNIELLLGPTPDWMLREQMTKERFEWLAPLLVAQPWIKTVEFSPKVPSCDFNLNDFRKTWFSPRSGCAKRRRLFETYAEHFRHPPLREDEPWLSVDPIPDEARPIIISRTGRYQDKLFNWQRISNFYAGRMRFIGYLDEFESWTGTYGKTAEFIPVKDALEMARVIAGAKLFIGNQSLPMALALALNVSLIQEVFPGTPDCIFHRTNAIYSNRGRFDLPAITVKNHRYVSNTPNAQGLIELGPCEDAFGLGDFLSITPLAQALGDKAIMLMPQRCQHLAFLFLGLCPVRFTDNFPVFDWRVGHAATMKLARFSLHTHSPIPVVKLSPEALHRAKPLLSGIPNPVAFNPTCSLHWAHVRERPHAFWKPVVAELAKRFTVCQFGRQDYETVTGARRMPFVDLETLAGCYSLIQNYVGVHTGDHHLMLAVGGRCVVAEPEPIPEFHNAYWSYDSPRIIYARLNHPQTVLDAIKRLPL